MIWKSEKENEKVNGLEVKLRLVEGAIKAKQRNRILEQRGAEERKRAESHRLKERIGGEKRREEGEIQRISTKITNSEDMIGSRLRVKCADECEGRAAWKRGELEFEMGW